MVGMDQMSGQQWALQPHLLPVPSACLGEALPDTSRLRQQVQSDHLKTSRPTQHRHHGEPLPALALVASSHSLSLSCGS